MATATEPSSHWPASQASKRCVDCKSPIHPDAKVCPQCRGRQSSHLWLNIGKFLKWVAAITAVFTLGTTLIRANELYQDYKNRRQAVSILVQSGNTQRSFGDYAASWASYQEALELDPGHADAWTEQIELAMVWLRDIRIVNQETAFTQIVDQITPVLHRGSVLTQGTRQADIFAHLGYATFLRYRDRQALPKQVDRYYDCAQEIEPHNTYANTFRGHWLLWHHQDLEEAMQCFDRALETGRERDYVRHMQLAGCFNQGTSAQTRGYAAKIANQMRQEGQSLSDQHKGSLLYGYRFYLGRDTKDRDQFMAWLSPQDHLATFQYLIDGMAVSEAKDRSKYLLHQVITATLLEAAGDTVQALAIYRAIQQKVGPQMGQKRGRVYYTWEGRVLDRIAALSGDHPVAAGVSPPPPGTHGPHERHETGGLNAVPVTDSASD